ncbi:MAG: acylneuraminate cytidylyltransferase family protein [Clostridium beijerinckii]|nr:acylneuraminate cytidylyltransferase family protein [Clostridium beijerinckii]
MNKSLAIIPARSGSKGLENKNIKLLNNKPLISYTIEAALKSSVFSDVLVSTDSEEYKRIAEIYGAWVPFLRSKELAEDTTSTNDVIENILITLEKMGEKYDNFMILQPTSPLRDENDIKAAIDLFGEKDANSVVSMCECEHPPIFTTQLSNEKHLDGFLSNLKYTRRQELNRYYRLNGAIYLAKVDYFKKYKDFYREKSYAYIMDKYKSVDIDDINDFIYAEFLMKTHKK